jgi:hypothetical protein
MELRSTVLTAEIGRRTYDGSRWIGSEYSITVGRELFRIWDIKRTINGVKDVNSLFWKHMQAPHLDRLAKEANSAR